MEKPMTAIQNRIKDFQGLEYHQQVALFSSVAAAVEKSVTIEIAPEDLEALKKAKYALCFAKKVAEGDYNVVWQSSKQYLSNNIFSWTPMYQMFGSNLFQANIQVEVSTNIQQIGLGETCILDETGYLKTASTGGPDISLTMNNQYGSIHPGINQLSTGLDGQTISTPIYVAQSPIVMGLDVLTPVETVLVWFQQNIETSTMFSTARSNSIEIDLTKTNSATRLYSNEQWSTPSG